VRANPAHTHLEISHHRLRYPPLAASASRFARQQHVRDFTAVAHYRRSLDDLGANRYGDELGRLRICERAHQVLFIVAVARGRGYRGDFGESSSRGCACNDKKKNGTVAKVAMHAAELYQQALVQAEAVRSSGTVEQLVLLLLLLLLSSTDPSRLFAKRLPAPERGTKS
jgi:hypothetical protein